MVCVPDPPGPAELRGAGEAERWAAGAVAAVGVLLLLALLLLP